MGQIYMRTLSIGRGVGNLAWHSTVHGLEDLSKGARHLLLCRKHQRTAVRMQVTHFNVAHYAYGAEASENWAGPEGLGFGAVGPPDRAAWSWSVGLEGHGPRQIARRRPLDCPSIRT